MYKVHVTYISLKDGVEEQHVETCKTLFKALVFYVLTYWGMQEELYPYGSSSAIQQSTKMRISIWK